MKDKEKRIEEIIQLAAYYQKNCNNLKDIRYKDWINLNSTVSQTLRKIIEAEDLLSELDDYSIDHEQCYPIFEDLKLQISSMRREFTDFVEQNKEVLEINQKSNN